MQPPGGVHQNHVGVPGLGGGCGVKDHGGGVRPLVLFDDVHAGPVGPYGQLVGGGGTEGVSGTEEFGAQLAADLSDGGGLAHPVHPDEQHHRGPGGQIQSGVPHGHGVSDAAAHTGPRLLHRLDVLLLHPAAQLLHKLQGGVHPRVRQDQGLLQFVVKVVGEFRAEIGKNIDFFQFVKETHGFVPSSKNSILCAAHRTLRIVAVIAHAAV